MSVRAVVVISMLLVGLSGLSLPVVASPDAALSEGAAAEAGAPPGLRLARYRRDGFIHDRRRLEARVGEAVAARQARGGEERSAGEIAAMLDLAEFDMAHVLAMEGLSVLAGIEGDLPPAVALRRDSLELALALVDSRDRPLSERSQAMLGAEAAGWSDQALFALLDRWRAGDMQAAGPQLTAAMERFDAYSEPLIEEVLPALLEVGVETGQWQAARELAERVSDYPRLEASGAYAYLLGRTAEAGGDLLSAFDSYRMAGAGGDLWAHRARIAMVEMGLRTETLSKPDALVLLTMASRAWRGDRHELAMLQRKAALEMELGDPIAALDTFAGLLDRFPDTPEASLVRQQTRSLWTSFYEGGAAGEITLSAFLEGHRRFALDYRFAPGFGEQTERFADRFLAAGATMVASDEYRDTHDYLMVARDLGIGEVGDSKLDALHLKQAEALMEGGQFDEAGYVLSEGLRSDDAEMADRLNTLKARLFDELGEAANVVRTSVSTPSLNYLRLRALAYFREGDWEGAQATYTEILDRTGDDMEFADAIRMLLACYRAGDGAAMQALVARFPKLSESPQWVFLARSMTQEAPALLPLRADTAEARVNHAGETLETLNALEQPKN